MKWVPNGLRYPLVGGIGHHPGALPGRDKAALPEPTPSHEKCLKTRTPRSGSPTTIVLVLFQGSGARCVGQQSIFRGSFKLLECLYRFGNSRIIEIILPKDFYVNSYAALIVRKTPARTIIVTQIESTGICANKR